jgi:hypothetical protein
MSRFSAGHLAIAAAVLFTACGLKPAGTSAMGSAGSSAGGAGGSGGGAAGMGGGGISGNGGGGSGGMLPPIIIDGGTDVRIGSNPDLNCGARSKVAEKVAPDILIVLDRSLSMNESISASDGGMGCGMNCGMNSKWAQIIPAINEVVGQTDTMVNWGLKFFPDSQMNCSVGTGNAVAVGPGNAGAIRDAIAAATSTNGGVNGFGGTPTRTAEDSASAYLATLTDPNPKFILLATDGQPTCLNNNATTPDDVAATAAVEAARVAGFKTFVVGIATGTGMANTTLGNMANMGGLPRTGVTPTYYPVSSQADLAAAIRTLIGVAATCTFQIGAPPSSDGTTRLDAIDVFGDGSPIDRDTTHTNGYDYVDASMMSIEVFGPLCEQIMRGDIREVAVTFRCIPL